MFLFLATTAKGKEQKTPKETALDSIGAETGPKRAGSSKSVLTNLSAVVQIWIPALHFLYQDGMIKTSLV